MQWRRGHDGSAPCQSLPSRPVACDTKHDSGFFKNMPGGDTVAFLRAPESGYVVRDKSRLLPYDRPGVEVILFKDMPQTDLAADL